MSQIVCEDNHSLRDDICEEENDATYDDNDFDDYIDFIMHEKGINKFSDNVRVAILGLIVDLAYYIDTKNSLFITRLNSDSESEVIYHKSLQDLKKYLHGYDYSDMFELALKKQPDNLELIESKRDAEKFIKNLDLII